MAHGHDGFRSAVLPERVQDGVKKGDDCGDTLQRKTLRAEVARLENLFEQVGANQAFENFSLVDLELWSFDALGNPLAPLRLRQVHELRANSAAIDAAGFVGGLSGESRELGALERFEEVEWVERRLVIAPAAKGVENSLALLANDSGFLGRFCRFRGALCFQGCPVCHNVYPTTFYFATDSKSGLSRPICRLLKELPAKVALSMVRNSQQDSCAAALHRNPSCAISKYVERCQARSTLPMRSLRNTTNP